MVSCLSAENRGQAYYILHFCVLDIHVSCSSVGLRAGLRGLWGVCAILWWIAGKSMMRPRPRLHSLTKEARHDEWV